MPPYSPPPYFSTLEAGQESLLNSIAAVVVVVCFGSGMFSLPSWTAIAGSALIIVWSPYVIYKLHRTRMKGRTKDIDLSVREYYEREAQSVDQQLELLRSVLWWYILPGFVGANLVFFGVSSSLVASGVYFVATLQICAGIWWLNQRAVVKNLLPVREEIGALLEELNETPNE